MAALSVSFSWTLLEPSEDCLISLHVGCKCSCFIFHTTEQYVCVWPAFVNHLTDSKRQTAGLQCPHQRLTTDRLRSLFCWVETLLLWKLGAVLDSGNNLAWPWSVFFFSHSVTLWPLSKPVTLLLLLLLLIAHQLCVGTKWNKMWSALMWFPCINRLLPHLFATYITTPLSSNNGRASFFFFFFPPYFLGHVVIKPGVCRVVFARIHGEKNQAAMIKKATRPGRGGTEPAAD